jgi:hypothetical protein
LRHWDNNVYRAADAGEPVLAICGACADGQGPWDSQRINRNGVRVVYLVEGVPGAVAGLLDSAGLS